MLRRYTHLSQEPFVRWWLLQRLERCALRAASLLAAFGANPPLTAELLDNSSTVRSISLVRIFALSVINDVYRLTPGTF
jgi:hypothetical protein